ncbi:hypothetical protein BJX64DRAFT_287337 [Aspergillus heterothallicus]
MYRYLELRRVTWSLPSRCIEVYQYRIHLQPLPLFSLDGLYSYVISAPYYLRRVFLALTIPLAGLNYYGEQKSQVVDVYSHFAQEAVMGIAGEG